MCSLTTVTLLTISQTFVLWNRMQDFYFRNDSRRNGRQIYKEHNAVVKGAAHVLEWEPEDGWDPLCNFLEVPVPKADFPNMNQAKAFQKTVDWYFEPRLRRAMRNLSLASASLLVGTAWVVLNIMHRVDKGSKIAS